MLILVPLSIPVLLFVVAASSLPRRTRQLTMALLLIPMLAFGIALVTYVAADVGGGVTLQAAPYFAASMVWYAIHGWPVILFVVGVAYAIAISKDIEAKRSSAE